MANYRTHMRLCVVVVVVVVVVCMASPAVAMVAPGNSQGVAQEKHSLRHQNFPDPHGADAHFASEENPAPGSVTVHIVCHTHDDTGWLKTVDQYYMGANNSIQIAGVQYILDSVVPALEANPSRKFIYVEQAFFQRWWRQQNANMRGRVQALIKNGQLELVNGGWCMHDEASTHYIAMLDQTTLGHRHITKEFGLQPSVGWQIDPFGHSSTQASLLSSEVGFDSLYFGRIDYQDRLARMNRSAMEFIWQASPTFGAQTQIFTGAFQSGNYGPPDPAFDYGHDCAIPVQDDPALHDKNSQYLTDVFVKAAYQQASHTLADAQGNKIVMFKLGTDFMYEKSNQWYKNLDKLINLVNADGRVKTLYSTPSAYTHAKFQQKITWPVKLDDFFPYADCEHCYWTGYFSSRPALKRYVRIHSNLLSSVRMMRVLLADLPSPSDGKSQPDEALEKYEESFSVAQHHDAVSGTSKQHVAYDYAERISTAFGNGDPLGGGVWGHVVSPALSRLTTGSTSNPWTFCPHLNETSCPIATSVLNTDSGVRVRDKVTEDGSLRVLPWNPLSQAVTRFIQVPVSSARVSVLDAQGNAFPSHQWDVLSNWKFGLPVVEGVHDASPYVLHVRTELPALGYSMFFVSVDHQTQSPEPDLNGMKQYLRGRDAPYLLTSAVYNLSFAGSAPHYLTSIQHVPSGVSKPVEQSWVYYTEFDRSRIYPYTKEAAEEQNGGAYIFRPNHTTAFPVYSDAGDRQRTAHQPTPRTAYINTGVRTTGLVQEFVQHLAPWLHQCVRLYSSAQTIEVEYRVGPVPRFGWDGVATDGGEVGKEVVARYELGGGLMGEKGVFYTDSNGREFVRRQTNYRPTWKLNVTEPVAGNFFPVNAAVYARSSTNNRQEGNMQFSVAVDRSLAVGLPPNNRSGVHNMEFIVHRRLFGNDNRGVGEPLNETQSITAYPNPRRIGTGLTLFGTQYLSLLPVQSSDPSQPDKNAMHALRTLMSEVHATPMVAFSPGSAQGQRTSMSLLSQDLPATVQLMTYEPLDSQLFAGDVVGNHALLRLAHQFALEELPSDPAVQVDLQALFNPEFIKLTAAESLSLTGNKLSMCTAPKLPWRTEGTSPREMVRREREWGRRYDRMTADVERRVEQLGLSDRAEACLPTSVRRMRGLVGGQGDGGSGGLQAYHPFGDDFHVTVKPMEIKTFGVEYMLA